MTEIVHNTLKQLELDVNNGIPDFLEDQLFETLWSSMDPSKIMKLTYSLFDTSYCIIETKRSLTLNQLILIKDMSFLPFSCVYEYWELIKVFPSQLEVFFDECQKKGFLIHPDKLERFDTLVRHGLKFLDCIEIERKIVLDMLRNLAPNVLISRLQKSPRDKITNELIELRNSKFHTQKEISETVFQFLENLNLRQIYETKLF